MCRARSANDGFLVFAPLVVQAGLVGQKYRAVGREASGDGELLARLFVLVLCGHGPATTIATEKRTNPFLQG
jgi:hypothetical protein